MQIENVIIIGGGPAGYTASLYAARANLEPLCIEGYAAGGQLVRSGAVENFPGFPEGKVGIELVDSFKHQAARFGARFLTTDVTEVDFSARPFVVSAGGQRHQALSVIVATGAKARLLGEAKPIFPGLLEAELALAGRGVGYCGVCDGPLFTGRRVVVIGSGDTAFEDAIALTSYASEVILLTRRELRASPIMVRYAMANEKISFLRPYTIEEILAGPENTVAGLRMRHNDTGEAKTVPCEGVFVAIGHDPCTELFKGWLELDQDGFIVVERGTSRTSVDGVFAAGDVQDRHYRQAITAAGSGCMAAMDAQQWLGGESSRLDDALALVR